MPKIKQIQRFTIGLLLCCAVFWGNVTAHAIEAAQTFDDMRKGSVTVALRDEQNNIIADGGFMLYYVADFDRSSPTMAFKLTDAFQGCGISLEDLRADDLAMHLKAYADRQNISGLSQQCDAAGRAVFGGLHTGLYLVVQSNEAAGYYSAAPFVVTVPMTNLDGTGWIYDIEAFPKIVERTTPSVQDTALTVKKIWENNGQSQPKQVEIALLREGKIIESIILSEENNWLYTWDGLDANYNWSVVENNVPNKYTVSYGNFGTKIVVTNTGETTPSNPSEPHLTNPPPFPGDFPEPSPPQPTNPPSHSQPPTLIQTGQLNWPIPVMAVLGMILLAIGLFILRRKKDDSHE